MGPIEPGVRERIVARAAIGDNEGASGARLERATLVDGTAVILKRSVCE